MTDVAVQKALNSIKQSGVQFPISERNISSECPITFVRNHLTGPYEAAEMMHLYVKHWADANKYEFVGYDGNRLLGPDRNGRIFDHLFYEFRKHGPNENDIEDIMFVFDVTEPLTLQDPFDLSYLPSHL